MSVRFNEGTGTEGSMIGKYGVIEDIKSVAVGVTDDNRSGNTGVVIGSVVIGVNDGVTDEGKSGDVGVVIIGVINGCRLGNTGVVMLANAGDGVHEEEVRDVIGEKGFVVSILIKEEYTCRK